MKRLPPLFILLGLLISSTLSAHEYTAMLTKFAHASVVKWVNNKALVDAIKTQNQANANLGEADIAKLDTQWENESHGASKPLIDSKLHNAAADYLRTVQNASNGQFSEVFIMDNKGLVVAMADATTDYWQGDENKFQESFGKGVEAVHVGPVVNDESTGIKQCQVSMTIVDNGVAIGAVTVGINPKKIDK